MSDMRIVSDMRFGATQPPEDLVISALVMAPFPLAFVILLGWMMPVPSPIAILIFLTLTAVGALWNAGWRARTLAG